MQTLERNTLNEVNWLLYASPQLYATWKSVVAAWMDGSLAGGDGEISGKPRGPLSVTGTMFKCFEGDLSDKRIRGILRRSWMALYC